MARLSFSVLTITLLLLVQHDLVHGFMSQPNKVKLSHSQKRDKAKSFNTIVSTPSSSSSSFRLNLSETDLGNIAASSEDARKLFYLWFFGGSGGGGIAATAFPKMYDRFQTMRSLKDDGPTLGGESIELSPLCGYPRDIALADVEKVLGNSMSVERMVKEGPQDNFLAGMGYLRFEAFVAANEGCNPLAVRAVFDALTTSTSTVEPDTAQDLLDQFRTDIPAFKRTLLFTKLAGWSAIGVLVFLLGLTFYVCGEALAKGWFPDWPGNENFPVGLLIPGVWTIPEYWI